MRDKDKEILSAAVPLTLEELRNSGCVHHKEEESLEARGLHQG